MPSPNDRIGPYTLIRQLGKGAFGVVWLAERRGSLATTEVALKLLLEEEPDLEAIGQESRLWSQAAGHPNVLPIIEADVYDDRVVVVSEYAPDGSLQHWLDSNGGTAPTVESAVKMSIGILEGLEHLHSKKIVHRDLKPANVLLQGETPRLADFGLARVLKGDTSSASIAGTPSYMAPEAFDGKRSERSDLWAVGVILYRMLTGHHPFPQGDMAALVGAIIARQPEPLPESVPASVRRVVARSMQKDPALRFPSAAEMRDALRQALSSPEATTASFRAPIVVAAATGGTASAMLASGNGTFRDRRSTLRSESFPSTLPYAPPAEPAWQRNNVLVPALIAAVLMLGLGAWWMLSRGTPLEEGNPIASSVQTPGSSDGTLATRSDVDSSRSANTNAGGPAVPASNRPAGEGLLMPDGEAASSTAAPGPVSTTPQETPGTSVHTDRSGVPEMSGVSSDPPPSHAPSNPSSPQPRASNNNGGIDGTWQEQGGDCSGSTIVISGGGSSVSGTANCSGFSGHWTGRVIGRGANYVMYQKDVNGQTVTCKIHFQSNGQGWKETKMGGKHGGSSQVVKIG